MSADDVWSKTPTASTATQTAAATTARPCQRGTRATTQSSANATAMRAKNAMNTEMRLYERMYRNPAAEMSSENPLTVATTTATMVTSPRRFPISARVPSGGGPRDSWSLRRPRRRLSVNTRSPTNPRAPARDEIYGDNDSQQQHREERVVRTGRAQSRARQEPRKRAPAPKREAPSRLGRVAARRERRVVGEHLQDQQRRDRDHEVARQQQVRLTTREVVRQEAVQDRHDGGDQTRNPEPAEDEPRRQGDGDERQEVVDVHGQHRVAEEEAEAAQQCELEVVAALGVVVQLEAERPAQVRDPQVRAVIDEALGNHEVIGRVRRVRERRLIR